ncbi:Glucan 1,3-beta-glucosidase [Leucoagaricus sp. SymC.cos]|nr:Glucan 1,3-beta-glucosidase [Leucoagaricus sp. SymC.cos]
MFPNPLILLPFVALSAATKCTLKVNTQLAGAQAPLGTSVTSEPTTTTQSATGISPSPTAFDYSRTKVRGVNLGGWLVLEPWITPSLFEATGNDNIVDEFTLGQFTDPDAAQKLLKSHWESWITEDDFVAMSAAGLNHVRIPIGYWSIPLPSSATNTSTDTSPYITGAWPYFLRALNWARKYSIHVILDIHGAPGSQNGYDNSGQRTPNPVWAVNPANVTRTVDTIRWLTENVGGMVDIIELLNEAAGFRGPDWGNTIRQYWLDGYDTVRAVEPASTSGDNRTLGVMIGDAFMGLQTWDGFLTPPRGDHALIDLHSYQIFSDLELNRTFSDHIAYACSTLLPSFTSFAASNIWTVVGEWSAALTDCAKWLNGRGTGSSCDGWTGSWNGTDGGKGFSDQYKNMLRQYWELQVEIGEAVQGWIYWTWKTEIADEWSYQKGLEGGWIPSDPTNRKYPNMCG